MNRFEITNQENGMKFVVLRESIEPTQPEWGVNPVIVKTDISTEIAELAAKEQARKSAKIAIKQIDFTKIAAPIEIRDALEKIVVALGLKD